MQNKFKHYTGLAAFTGYWLRKKHFTEAALTHLAQRIAQGESTHTGELVVAVEGIMPSHEPNAQLRALEVYGRLRVWDTPLNSGVLLYLALDKRAIEIVADRGITARNEQWQQICKNLQTRFAKGDYVNGLNQAVDDIQIILSTHAPLGDPQQDVLPNQPILL